MKNTFTFITVATSMAEPSTTPDQNNTTTPNTNTDTNTNTTSSSSSSWGTSEELLLACAVHRYGTNSWDSVAIELQKRNTSSSSLFTPHICQLKYRDLKRRFSPEDPNSADDTILCLDELRRLRVAELRRELHRYDLSIVSLQLKVKRLKEEGDTVVEIKRERENQSDLQENEQNGKEISEVKDEPMEETEPDEKEKPDEPGGEEEQEQEQENESCNGSSNSKKERVDSGELVESVAESVDDGGEREEGVVVKEMSDVQSTASLWMSENNNNININNNKNNNNEINDNSNNNNRRDKKVGLFSGNSSGEENQYPVCNTKTGEESKTQALVEFLDIVRARKLGSVFERRLQTQETPKYRSLIKQHIDLGIIQGRLEEGQYTDCHTKFYRDLTLLINNAIIFFSKRTSEHKGALELRRLLNKQIQTHSSLPYEQKSQPSKSTLPASLPKPTKPEPNQADLKPKLTVTGPVIASRKRSSIAGKFTRGGDERKERALVGPPSEKTVTLGEMMKQQGEKTTSASLNNSLTKKRAKDQSFGSRSSSSKNNDSNPSPSNTVSGKGESSIAKADKKKPSPGNSLNKMKQQGSGSGSGRSLLLESLKNSDKRKSNNDGNGGNVKNDRRKDEVSPKVLGNSKLVKEKVKAKEEKGSLGNRSNKRPPKRAAAIAAMGKRGRDGGGEADPQPKKRQRK